MTDKTYKNTDYDVGYKKPPEHSQFPPGVSGNPNGRPKGARNKKGEKYYKGIEDVILKEAYREVELTENGQRIKMPVAQAGLRALAIKAAKGDVRANQILTKYVSEIERNRAEDNDRKIETIIDYKVDWEIERERRNKLGLEMPDLEIDPDDIVVNHKAGELRIVPKREQERLKRIELQKMKKSHEEEVIIIQAMIEDPEGADKFDMLKVDLDRSRKIITRIEKLLSG